MNLPIYALYFIPFHLLGKLTLLMILFYSSCIFSISLTHRTFLLAFNYTHFSQDSKSFQKNCLYYFCSSLPFIFFKELFTLNVHISLSPTHLSNKSHCSTESAFLKVASTAHIAKASGHFSVTFT